MHIHVPLVDLTAAHAELQAELESAALDVLRSGWYILGPQVSAFEAEFAAWLGLPADNAASVASGTDALVLALRACDVGPGAEVIVPSHTAVATAAAVELAGARPVFADIRPDTFTLDPDSVAAAVSSRTRAIVPVHLYGQPAPDIDALVSLAHAHDAWLIEDCAQAHGAHLPDSQGANRPVGTIGDAGCFSFYPTKNLGAAGDGGMVVSRDARLAERIKLLRQYGWRERYVSDVPGLNSRLDELQAALLRVKLRHLEAWTQRRRQLAARYDDLLAATCVTPPRPTAGATHVYHLYVIRTAQRSALRAHLATYGIATAIHYPVPVHRQPAYRHLAPDHAAGWPPLLPETERAAAEVLSLPLYPQLAERSLERVASAIMEFEPV